MKCELCNSELEQKVADVKKDHAGGDDNVEVSDKVLMEDTNILNPDPETLDRG